MNCEICGKPHGKFNTEFDGYACEEGQSQWTENATDDWSGELDAPPRQTS